MICLRFYFFCSFAHFVCCLPPSQQFFNAVFRLSLALREFPSLLKTLLVCRCLCRALCVYMRIRLFIGLVCRQTKATTKAVRWWYNLPRDVFVGRQCVDARRGWKHDILFSVSIRFCSFFFFLLFIVSFRQLYWNDSHSISETYSPLPFRPFFLSFFSLCRSFTIRHRTIRSPVESTCCRCWCCCCWCCRLSSLQNDVVVTSD